jgi:hypothetical protein
MKKNDPVHNTVTWIWIINGIGVLCVLFAAAFYAAGSSDEVIAQADTADASPALHFPTRTPRPTITAVPQPTQRATITPIPFPTKSPSVTPLAIPPGNKKVIGYSVEGRPIEAYRYGNGEIDKLIVAGIHGGYEWNTIALASELIVYLNDNEDQIPSDVTLHIVRNLNPDGEARVHGVEGRANANNVDLNRNWPYNWVPDWNRDGCWIYRPITGGEYEGSEPEVQALIKYIDQIKPQAIISYHSAALGIFDGGRPPFQPSIDLAEAVASVSDYPYPPIDTGCDYTGNLTDWAANTREIPSIDIELTNHRDTDFDQNLRILEVFLDWRP